MSSQLEDISRRSETGWPSLAVKGSVSRRVCANGADGSGCCGSMRGMLTERQGAAAMRSRHSKPDAISDPRLSPEPCAHFDHPAVSNGPTANLNLKIKNTKRTARGYRNFTHYRVRLLFNHRRICDNHPLTRIRTRRPRLAA